jgi:amino acid adenylation domain-containing protein
MTGSVTPQYPGPTIHELVEGWATATPSAPAVLTTDGVITYEELNTRADRLAATLRRHGVGPESRVGVLMPRSAQAIVAFLAVLKAGGAYVPLDPEYPPARRGFMLADSRIAVLITDTPTDVPATITVIYVNDSGSDRPAEPEPAMAPAATARNCAYVIYTSGSTGTPKGVMVEHHCVVSLISNDSRLAIAPGQTVAHLAPTAFDASVFEIWGALCRGARVAVFPARRLSLEELGRQLRHWRPDWLFLTTGLFHLLADFDLAALASVGQLITGGDVLNPERVRAAATMTTVYAAYGPTEATVFSTLHAASSQHSPERMPLGSALTGVRIHVLDDQLRRVPDGEVGELYIGGTGVARGYHAQPELTSQRFFDDPYENVVGARIYRTGDLGRVLPNGEVEFHGRVDRQVKVRGFRIELDEIESVLLTAPDVTGAAVLAVPGLDGDKRLAAYVSPAPGAALSISDLRAWTSARLPNHAIPAIFVIVDQMPLDTNGKVDRAALPTPWASRDDLTELPPYQPPRTEIERVMSVAWADALELDRVGTHDEFFALGGDSLRSVAVLERLRSVGMAFTAGEFFSHPTVAELASLYHADRDAAGVAASVAAS